ncbi:MAG: hypothetical protein U0P48_13655, partial [Ancrocorticia sp.]
VGVAGQGVPLVAEFDRGKPRLGGGDLGHQLIDRDRVPFGRPDLGPGQPDAAAVVVVAQAVRVVESAEWGDDGTMLLQRRE